jgi:hypothetical protein
LTTWVVENLDDVLRKDFKLEDHDTDFISLTDQETNKLLQEVKLLSF